MSVALMVCDMNLFSARPLITSALTAIAAVVCLQAHAGTTAHVSAVNWDEWRSAYAESKAETTSVLSGLGDGSGTVGLEFIFAGAGTATGSGFGHALLRFVNAKGIPENDAVLALVADVSDQPTIDPIKGLFGGYAITVEANRLANVVRSYAIDQKRSLTRYVVPSTLEQRKSLLASYNAIFKQDKKHAEGYRFATKNCSSVLQKLLLLSGIAPMPMIATTPALVSQALRDSLVSPYPGLEIVNPVELQIRLTCLSQLDCDFVQFRLKDLIQFATVESLSIDSKRLRPLVNEIARRRSLGEVERDALPLKALPLVFYRPLSEVSLETEQIHSVWIREILKSNCSALTEQLNIVDISPLYRGSQALQSYKRIANQLCL